MANFKHDILVIIGAGGHGRVVADCAQQIGHHQKIMFLDDCYNERNMNAHWPIEGQVNTWSEYLTCADFIVAFGHNALRLQWHQKLLDSKANIISLIHPQAIISQHTELGLGCVVFAGAVINIGSRIGQACIINTSACIDHDADIADAVHVSPNASLAGQVSIGEKSWVGINATVIQCIVIAENCQIGAGAVVVSNTHADALYVGVPAKLIKSFQS
jgi:sugar O-acyltransferase (sialic acid O-acetyltransferase NeuD family)